MDGWNLLILGVVFAGHCELMAAWINRLHAVPLTLGWLALTQRVHDALVIAFLPWFIFLYGVAGPRILLGGSWSELPPLAAAYVALCGVGAGSLLLTIVKRAVRTPEAIVESHTYELGRMETISPTGPGWRGAIARWPRNEVTSIELNHKRIGCRGLHRSCQGLTIAHFSDVHFYGPISLDYFRFVFDEIRKLNADLICFTGDLLDDPDKIDWLPETFGTLSAPLGCWFVLGNHDWLYGTAQSRQALVSAGWQDLGGQSALLKEAGRTIWLAGDETPWFEHPFDAAEADQADLRILLTHTPDHFPAARRAGIELTLAGHNHGGQICLPAIGPVYSPSRYGVRYAGGTFRRGDSVLHVSRGVSAKRPVRWRCRPEVTRLELVSAGPSKILPRHVDAREPQHNAQEQGVVDQWLAD